MQVCYLLNLQNVPECRSRVIFNYRNQRDRKDENKFAFKKQKLFDEKICRDLTRKNAMKSSHVSNDCFYVVETTVEVSLKNEAYDENCKTGSGA